METPVSQADIVVLTFACGWMLFYGGSSGRLWKEYIFFQIIRNFCLSCLLLWVFGFGVVTTTKTLGKVIPLGESVHVPTFNVERTMAFLHHLSNLWLFVSMGTMSMVERARDEYVLIQVVWDSIISYPILAFWTSNAQSWLVQLGFVDEKLGSVFLAGGIAALTCTKYMGVRRSKFDANEEVLQANGTERNAETSLMGIFLMFVGVSFFHSDVHSPHFVSLLLCVSGSCMYSILRRRGLTSMLNACVIGLVASSGAQLSTVVWPSVVLGFLAAISCDCALVVGRKWWVDDAFQFYAMQIGPSILALLSIGIAGNSHNVYGLVHELSARPPRPALVVMRQLLVQLLGIALCVLFSAVSKLTCMCMADAIHDIRINGEVETFGFPWCNSQDTAHERAKLSRELWKIFSQNPTLSKTLCAEFHKYLAERYCQENWDFLVAIAEYHAICVDLPVDEFNHHRDRFRRLYLDQGAKKEVNISTGARNAVKRSHSQQNFCMLAEKEIRDLLWHHFKDFARGSTKDLLLLRDKHSQFSTFLKRRTNELELMNQSSLWSFRITDDWHVLWSEETRQSRPARGFSLSFPFACGANRDGAVTPSATPQDENLTAYDTALQFSANFSSHSLSLDDDIFKADFASGSDVFASTIREDASTPPEIFDVAKLPKRVKPDLVIRVESQSALSHSSPGLRSVQRRHGATPPEIPTPSELELPPLTMNISSTATVESSEGSEVKLQRDNFNEDKLVML